jgi:hypothetical protein
MKILLVHPEDSLEQGEWTKEAWDLIVDLGWSGRCYYQQQAARFGCRVVSVYGLLDHEQRRRQLRKLLDIGRGIVVDAELIDWWDLFSPSFYQEIEQLMLLAVLAGEVAPNDEIRATSPHFLTRAFSILIKSQIAFFSPAETESGLWPAALRYMKKALAFHPSQLLEIIFDKWDTGYRMRRLLKRRPARLPTPVVLLPSAYVNVSRAQVSYAAMLPRARFLLVVTRRSGLRLKLPANIELRALSAYAPGSSTSAKKERDRLLGLWGELLNEKFAQNGVLGLAVKLEVFKDFAGFVSSGLQIRDAWREVITQEPITAVLSADEHNAFTRLPITLAKSRNVPTVFADHGALNMSLAMRPAGSDMYLAAGEMARDYMVEWCGLPAEKVVVAGSQREPEASTDGKDQRRDWIVYFSEPYEVYGARTEQLYREILPELAALAQSSDRKVIVKLHPFESHQKRRAMIDRIVPAELRGLIELREGSMTPDLLHRAWFSITVKSSATVESAINGVPCFLCEWFDGVWDDYGKQYAKYSAGWLLGSPEEIRGIPRLLERIEITEAERRGLHSAISPERLEGILSGASR